jgi:hypothetical protein
MRAIREAAWFSVGRGCAYAILAIMCFVLGLSWNPLLAARSGGVLLSLMTLILIWMANRATRVPYRTTEVWLLLDEGDRPHPEGAQFAIALQRREALLTFASYSAAAAAFSWALALLLWFWHR